MRDHVAEACKVSKSKLSRLAVIRDRLAPDIRKAYWEGGEKGRLNESAAYELARLPGGRFQPFGIGQRFRRHVETGFFG